MQTTELCVAINLSVPVEVTGPQEGMGWTRWIVRYQCETLGAVLAREGQEHYEARLMAWEGGFEDLEAETPARQRTEAVRQVVRGWVRKVLGVDP